MPTDHYAILEVPPGATATVIKAAYRRLAKEFHPDLNASPEAQSRMLQINQAWEVLSDPAQRAAFDRSRPAPPRAVRRQAPGPRAGAARRPSPAPSATEDAPREPQSRPGATYTGDASIDWYAFLGVRPDAPRQEILKALARMAATMSGADITATEVIRRRERQREAWAVLGDPHIRASYDSLRKGLNGRQAPPEPGRGALDEIERPAGERIGPVTVNGRTVDAGLDLSRADLRGADLHGLDLAGIDLSAALLQGVNLEAASLRKARLRDADLSGANLRHADLSHADLTGATLRQADLHRAALHATVLVRANLGGASLVGVLAPGVNLDFADLTRADLTGAKITFQLIERARCDATIFPDGTVRPAG
jgi:curved DNA-binding protein CbpA